MKLWPFLPIGPPPLMGKGDFDGPSPWGDREYEVVICQDGHMLNTQETELSATHILLLLPPSCHEIP